MKVIKKPKIMLHIIMPNQVSGPNNASRLIADSFLSSVYNFNFLTQKTHAGGRVNFSLIKNLKKQIKEFNPDVIHLSGLQSSGFHAVIAAKLCRKKVILAVRGSSVDAIGISKKLKFAFRQIIEPITLHLSDKVYTVCKAMESRDFIQNNTKGRLIGTIHNSAPIINTNSIKCYNLKEKFRFDEDAVIVTIVGRMVYDKGITFIAEAIKQINNKNIKFLFVGNAPKSNGFEESLKLEVGDQRVFFLGKQEKNEVLSILKESDIFLFATLHENLSNALLEALALGLSVIATNVGGNPEVVTNGYNGLLIAPKDSDSIVKSVSLLASDVNMRKRLGQNALKVVQEKFSQELLLKRLHLEYQKMI